MNAFLTCCLLFLPLKNLSVTSVYGYRIHPVTGKYQLHSGVDLKAKHDTVYAILDGSVNSSGYDDFLGIYIRLDHTEIQSLYGHLSAVFVSQGETIAAGQPIGITGATGRVTGEHLHFSINYHGKKIDPLKFLYHYLMINNNE
jgi:murein DD-endopeptidase MepM/ murein hydrolase activator NlpD